MAIGQIITAVTSIIDKVVPDPNLKMKINAELESRRIELEKLEAAETASRIDMLKAMFSNPNLFVSGGIPALIWVFVAAIANNYILLPWAKTFGFAAPSITLPTDIVALIGTVIITLLGKKAWDNNEIWRPDGTLLSPSKDQVKAAIANGKTEPVGKSVIAERNFRSLDADNKKGK